MNIVKCLNVECQKDFKNYGKQNRKYCSQKCMSEVFKTKLKGENNPNYRHGPRKCKQCGIEISRNAKRFCVQCASSGENNPFYGKNHSKEFKENMSKNWHKFRNNDHWIGRKHSEESKKKMSNSHKLQWNNATELQRKKRLDCLSKLCANQLDFKSTVPEKIVSEILNNKGIKYTKNAYLYNKFFVDFLLEDGRIIEVFGDYWHGNPDMFTTLNKQQQRQNNKDKSRLAYLKKCGHEIIVIWENRKGRHNYDEMKLFVDKNIHNSSSK